MPLMPRDHRAFADPHELMDRDLAAEKDVVAHRDMTAENRIVGEDHVVADAAIMRDVGADHDEQRSPTVVVPPPSSVPIFIVTFSRISQSAPIDQRRRPAPVARRLRRTAERRERSNARARTDRGVALEYEHARQLAAVADHDIAADHAIRPDRRRRAR